MAEDTIQILRVDTGEAVRSVNDLRDNVKVLKERLGDLEIGTQEYQDTLDELKVNQNAVKDAMYATTASMDDLTKSATGTSNSYNSLVHRMAALKEELRATDVSTEEGRKKFKELAGQINEVNNTLKDMDALQGNFQRNVGNYPGLMKKWSGSIDALDKGFKATSTGLGGLKGGFDALAVHPITVVIGVIIGLITTMKKEIQGNEEAMKGINQAGISLKPIMMLFQTILQKVAQITADLISKVGEFVNSNGLLPKVTEAVVGVGNAILKFIVAPFKGVIEAIKIFKEQGVKGLGDAAKAFGKEVASGVSFKTNYATGAKIGDSLIAGLNSQQPKMVEAGEKAVSYLEDGIYKSLDKMLADLDKEVADDMARFAKDIEDSDRVANALAETKLANMDKAVKHQLEMNNILEDDERKRADNAYEIQLSANQRRLEALKQFADDALERGDTEAFLKYDQQRADLEVEIEVNAAAEKKRIRERDMKDAEDKAKQQIAVMQSVAGATSGILSSIADMYESDEKNSEKNAEKIKALRIASATIDTISGAIGAFMQATETMPPPIGAIVGSIQAAAITAAGIAQIAKMKSTKVSGSANNASPSAPAIVSAPTPNMDIPQYRNVTSASEEERLNQMASDQRVVLVMSDLEVRQNQSRVALAEASF